MAAASIQGQQRRASKALSIRQPWAELILDAGKTVENRTWSTNWRGPLVVHAGQQWDPHGAMLAFSLSHVMHRRTSPTGYLGVVDLTDVHPDDGCCRPWGEPNCFHWVLHNPLRFANPLPGKGRLGLYNLPKPVLDLLHLLGLMDVREGA